MPPLDFVLRRMAVLLAVLLGAVGCGGGGGETTRVEASECRPTRPERIATAPLGVENLMVSAPRTEIDTDGDGEKDGVSVDAGAVAVTRADGQLRFTEAGHAVALQAWGDLNGDGRDDLVLADSTPASRAGAVYLVDGATAPGTYAPAAAGVRVDDHVNYPWLQDLDGAPGVDLVVPVRQQSDSYTNVYGGAGLLGAGPGGDARGTAPVSQVQGLTRGVAPLAEGDEPETLLLSPDARPAVRFAARPEALLESPFEGAHRAEDILVFDENGVRKVALQIDDRVAVWPAPAGCPR